jgi:hypothetical protein
MTAARMVARLTGPQPVRLVAGTGQARRTPHAEDRHEDQTGLVAG